MNLIMAHRGWSSRAPENTMAAFRLAFEDERIQAIELDVQLSADNIPVVIHDYTLGRTTNGSGYVFERTYRELAQLDAGSWFSPQFVGERIPTLEQVLGEAKGRSYVNIELKSAGELYPDLHLRVLEVVQKLGMEAQVCFTSFNHPMIQSLNRETERTLETGLIFCGSPTLLFEQMKETGAGIMSICYPFLTPTIVHQLLKEHIEIVAWTVNITEHIRRLQEISADIQICTDYPERAFI
jgi:glycerophosphoryl diester phosphodiesterase